MGGLFIKNKCKKMLKLTNTNEKKFKKRRIVIDKNFFVCYNIIIIRNYAYFRVGNGL